MNRFRIVVVLALSVFALVACQPVKKAPPAGAPPGETQPGETPPGETPPGETPPTSAPLPPPDTYVALGDSFVAGPLIPVQDLGPTAGCLRSSNNYPSLAWPSTGLPNFVDVSCSGARTKHMTEEQGVDPGPNPPQFDALTVTTGLVTLGIGGNDIGFSEIAENCGGPPFGTRCQDTYVTENGDELRQRIAATAPLVDDVLDGIRERAPQAEIVVVNYLRFFPPGPLVDGLPEGCYAQLPISPEDVDYLRGIEEALNQMLADQAAANGAELVDVYVEGHDACQPPGIRWVEPLVPIAAAPLHPNLQGMMAVADMVEAAISS